MAGRKRKLDELDLGGWCILRMAAADTIKLAKSLARAGLTVWTPIEQRIARTPRRRVQYEREIALMPTYIFARSEELETILSLAVMPQRDHARFSVFHCRGGVPLVSDHDLAALRAEEDRMGQIYARAKRAGRKGPKIEAGSTVKLATGPFDGMSGIVEGQEGNFTLVSFEGFHEPIKIASILLLDEEAETKAA